MEVPSTGDLLSKVGEINEREIAIEEDIDLEQVDNEIEEQKVRAQERYDNFDTELLKDGNDNTLNNLHKTYQKSSNANKKTNKTENKIKKQ